MRPSWDDVWMEMAHVIAQRSRCIRSAVGCVIVTKHNAVVAVGYNGPPAHWHTADRMKSGCDSWCPRTGTGGGAAYYDDCVSSHAEMNALVRGARADFEGGVLYVTRMPCFTCAKVIANSGIDVVVYKESEDDVDREPERSRKMLMDSDVSVIKYG